MKKFLLGLISIYLLNGIYAERLKAGLDSQFEQETSMKCDESNAKFIAFTSSGRRDAYACIFNGVVYYNVLKYAKVYDANGNFAGPPIGYYGMRKGYSLGKQTSKFTNSGNIELKLYKEAPEGIVRFTCISNEIGGKCSTKVTKKLMYQRRN